MKKLFILLILVLITSPLLAQQFDLSAEIRPRFESKHGYKTLSAEDVNAANFISQRTRLNFKFQQNKIKLGISLQNVRVWGDVSTLSPVDKNASALHEAWAEAKLSDQVSLKLGRQEIVYDDHRIFGSVGWAQQARSHDAFLVKFTPAAAHKIDLGFALNADNQGGTDDLYSNVAGYKAFQYAWYHGNFDKLGLSILLLNSGKEYLKDPDTSDEKQKVDYMQTIGPRLTYKSGDLSANAATYFQTGTAEDKKVNALYYTVNLGYKVMDGFKVGIGYEHLSGKAMDDSDIEIKSFAPLFGTNHKFNGWMDYFYVGNHGGSVGLNDFSAVLVFKKDKFSAKLIPHFFSAAADVIGSDGKMDANLGTEIDLTLGYSISKNIKINAGYSQMFATETMEVLKGGDKDVTNNWAWLMFTFKPKLFSTTTK